MIQAAFVDMQNMFDMLDVDSEVKDIPNALPLSITRGQPEFKNVYFHYVPEKPILRNVLNQVKIVLVYVCTCMCTHTHNHTHTYTHTHIHLHTYT